MAAAGIWEFTAALAHKDNCLQASFHSRCHAPRAPPIRCLCVQIMAMASASGRQGWLAVVYDHLAREEWSRRAGHNEPSFDVDQVRAVSSNSHFVASHLHASGHAGEPRSQ